MNDREQFERWASDEGLSPRAIEKNASGSYKLEQVANDWRVWQAARATPAQPVPHSDDLAVDRFAAAMKAKMAASRAKGRSGWDDERQCPMAKLSNMLIAHARKGDPVDVANFAMMLQQREQMEIEHHPCHAGIATVSLRSAMDELLGTVDGENMDWKQQATLLALEKIARPSPASDVGAPSPSSVGHAIRAMPLPDPWERGDGNHEDKYLESQVREFRCAAAAIVEKAGRAQIPILQARDLKALKRFFECCDDPDSGGHDVSKEAMARLREIGVVESKGFGRHQITAFGDYVLCVETDTAARFPLKTYAEYEADSKAAHEAKLAAPSIAQDGQKSEADHG